MPMHRVAGEVIDLQLLALTYVRSGDQDEITEGSYSLISNYIRMFMRIHIRQLMLIKLRSIVSLVDENI